MARLITAVIVLIILVVGLSNAAMIDFDNFPAGINIQNQYLGTYGVSFLDARIVIASVNAASGKQVLEVTSKDNEFHPGPLVINFASGQSQVKMAIGINRKYPPVNQVDAVLKAFDSAGKLVESSAPVKIGPPPTPITTPVEVKSNQDNIYRVELLYTYSSNDPKVFEAIDNLEFSSAVPPPTDQQAPVVKIGSPKTGDITQNASFQLDGTIQEETNLADVWIKIEQQGKQTISYQLKYYDNAPIFTFGKMGWMGSLYEGKNTITVTAEDIGKNVGQDSVTVTFPPVDLFPTAMEITQGINQVIALSNPPTGINTVSYSGTQLVAGKQTVVRVYGGVTGAMGPVKNVLCHLIALQNNVELPGSPLLPSPAHITLNPGDDINTQRANINMTWNFTLPNSWIKEGVITLIASVNPKLGVQECSNCYNTANKMYVTGVYFKKTPKLHIYPFRTCVRRLSTDPTTTCDVPGQADTTNAFVSKNSLFPMMFPVADGDVEIHIPSDPIIYFDGQFVKACTGNLGDMTSDRVGALLGVVSKSRTLDATSGKIPDSKNYVYVGVIPPPVCALEGLAHSSPPAAVALIKPDGAAISHEVGHTLGFGHSPCGDPDGVDQNYPKYKDPGGVAYPDASIGEWGLDTRTLELKNPAKTYDIMSYCGPAWISPYTYGKFLDWLNQSTSPAPSALAQRETYREYLLVTGIIKPDDQLQLDPLYRFTPALLNRMYNEQGQGKYSIELRNANNETLFTRYFDPVAIIDAGSDTWSIQQILPFVTGTAQVVIRHGEKELARNTASPNAPVVKILSPNGEERWGDVGVQTISWSAEDPDRDQLYYIVQYSIDNGKTWATIATDLTEKQLAVNPVEIAGSRYAKIRVLATDGFNTSFDDSDEAFAVMDKPPIINLISPINGSSYMQGRLVSLRAIGTDLEDGPLTDDRFTWQSQQDGVLGTGKCLDVMNLSPGTHEIMLIATDSAGNTVNENVAIRILPKPKIEILNPTVTVSCDQNTTYTIQFTWRAESSGSSLVVGPISLTTPGGETLRYGGPLPADGTMVIPVSPATSGSARICIEANDDGAVAFAEQNVTLKSCTEPECPVIGEFRVSLLEGVNIISVPLEPETQWHLSDLARRVGEGVSFIVWYDREARRFVSYFPDFPESSPANKLIEGGDGYIIVMKEPATVTFTGYPWSNTRIYGAPSMNQTGSPVLVIDGFIYSDETRSLLNGVKVLTRNLRTKTIAEDMTGYSGIAGRYTITFADFSGKRVAKPGDAVEISAFGRDGTPLMEPTIYYITAGALQTMHMHIESLWVAPIPNEFALLNNYPNPFNPETWIPYQLAEQANTTIEIYDSSGRLVRTLYLGLQPAGTYLSPAKAAYWDGKNSIGESVTSGVYFYVLKAGSFSKAKKMVILR